MVIVYAKKVIISTLDKRVVWRALRYFGMFLQNMDVFFDKISPNKGYKACFFLYNGSKSKKIG